MNKKYLISSAVIASLSIAAPIVYSVVKTSKTDKYESYSRIDRYKEINQNQISSDYGIPLRYIDYRNQRMQETGIALNGTLTTFEATKYGKLNIIKDVERAGKVKVGNEFQDNVKLYDVLQNDIYTVFLDQEYRKVFTIEELKDLFEKILGNVLKSKTLGYLKEIVVDFNTEKGSSSAMGFARNNAVSLSVNVQDSREKILDRIYYVTMHEMMHNETDQFGFNGLLLQDAMVDDFKYESVLNMDKYAELTNRPGLSTLAHQLYENRFTGPNINNAYLGDLPNSGYDGLSGYFESEIYHLYTNPVETIVEDLLSMTIGSEHSNQYNSQITGAVGSIGFRVSHDVSLLNVENRLETNEKILQSIVDSTQIKSQQSASGAVYSSPVIINTFNRTRIGFYSNQKLNVDGDLQLTLDNNQVINTHIKRYDTNIFMRTSPFGDSVVKYDNYFYQITLEDVINYVQNIDFKYNPKTENDDLDILQKVFGGIMFYADFGSPMVNNKMEIVQPVQEVPQLTPGLPTENVVQQTPQLTPPAPVAASKEDN